MSAASSRQPRRSWAWLLAFALWLPAAQWAAATHTLLHLHAAVSGEPEPATALPDACELCVVAAAVAGGAPATDPAALPASPAPQPQPSWTELAWPGPPAPLPYLTRAPPPPHA